MGRAKARGSIVGRHAGTGATDVIGNCVPATASTSPWCCGSGHATALLPLIRIVVRDLGVHPRGEFRTSGAAVGQIDTWAAKRPSAPNAEDCLSSEGGHQGLPRDTPKCRERWQSRAREAKGEPCARREVRKNARPESRATGPRQCVKSHKKTSPLPGRFLFSGLADQTIRMRTWPTRSAGCPCRRSRQRCDRAWSSRRRRCVPC
ncbi:hypothetical protein C8J98_101488 [Luteibacter sp. OK325]|nr:hypothetical protein C8J98_101488 [Luteibacter sp. OK325]